MSHNIVEKIWQQHVVQRQPGFPDVLAIDFALLHEVTSAQAFAELNNPANINDPNRTGGNTADLLAYLNSGQLDPVLGIYTPSFNPGGSFAVA